MLVLHYRLDDQGTEVRVPAGRDKRFSRLQNVQTGYGTQTAFYSKRT
jgi:hypothetical protein